jgi:NAD+ diphosphatase
VSGDPPVPVTLHTAQADGVVFLGLDADGHSVFATDLSAMEAEQAAELVGADRAVDVRMIVGTLSPAEAVTAGCGRGLLHRHRSQRFAAPAAPRMATADAQTPGA